MTQKVEQIDALVIGAGPAGLMAAEELARFGGVVVAEAKPTAARKFLMAGKSGLNVTKAEARAAFMRHYDSDWLDPMLADFGPDEVAQWCRDLGQEVFTGSSGRVFPEAMKASPLLRAWLSRLSSSGVEVRTRWMWTGWHDGIFTFTTPDGPRLLQPRACVLALGGASWPRLGSDAAWVPILAAQGVEIAPFKPANMGFRVEWSPHMTRHFGQAIKGAMLRAGPQQERGEFVLSARGLEGGGIYAISRHLREGAALFLNLLPDLADDELSARLARLRSSDSMGNQLRKLGLSPAAVALVMEFGRSMPMQQALRALPLRHDGPRPLAEAISSAGGVARSAVTDALALRAMPGVYVCGEMLDWEAPTGGYLLTGCWATGKWAGRHAGQSVLDHERRGAQGALPVAQGLGQKPDQI